LEADEENEEVLEAEEEKEEVLEEEEEEKVLEEEEVLEEQVLEEEVLEEGEENGCGDAAEDAASAVVRRNMIRLLEASIIIIRMKLY
jgi:hypothetical protein